MSIFGQILSSIFASSTKVEAALAQAALPEPVSRASASAQSGAQPKPAQTVDVADVLGKLAEKSDEDLDWRRSIVDLMKLLKLDSSLASRKRLAQELGYAGNMDDSASLNIWLHKQVMANLAEHGGKVPDELRS
jgi:hypothetical protein